MVERYNKPERSPDAPIYVGNAVGDEAPKKIILAGDTHGDAQHVGTLLGKARDLGAEAVFVLGDFGIWDHHDQGRFTDMVSKLANAYEVPVLFLPGNHDNYDVLFEWEATKPKTADGFLEIKPGLFYSPRGHRWTWAGVTFLSLGGAYSVDKDWRVAEDEAELHAAQGRQECGGVLSKAERYLLRTGQHRWWCQEEISEQEMRDAMVGGLVDVMLAHDKPRDARPGWNRKDLEECWPNQQRIQSVVDAVLPQLYVHGHLHYAYRDYLPPTGTVVQGLDCDPAASKGSGGSGKANRSWVLMDLNVKLNNVERGIKVSGADKDGEPVTHSYPLTGSDPFQEQEG